jgi:phosphoesterase RecJ-like protein
VTDSELSKLKRFLSIPRKIAIIMHKSPDGDAIGSSLGLYHFLQRFKHKASVISPNAWPDFLNWMEGTNKVIDYSLKPNDALKAIRSAELIVCLDFNALKRIEELGKEVAKSKAFKLMIDHHPQPENFADFSLHTVHASSTSELVFDFIELMGERKKINKAIANCLYAGIMTDTGSFRFSSTTVHTHNVTAALMEHGAETTRVHHLIDDTKREIRLKLIGFALLEKMKILPEYATGFIALTQTDLKHFDYRDGDTEGLVNEPLSVKGIAFSALFTEKQDGEGIKISFRSKEKFDVNQFARKHFNGGGHLNAAGGSSNLSMDETILKFLQLLNAYKEQLKLR